MGNALNTTRITKIPIENTQKGGEWVILNI